MKNILYVSKNSRHSQQAMEFFARCNNVDKEHFNGTSGKVTHDGINYFFKTIEDESDLYKVMGVKYSSFMFSPYYDAIDTNVYNYLTTRTGE